MAQKKADSTSALVAVVKALEPLGDDERRWVLQSAASRWTLNLQMPASAGNSGANNTNQSAVGSGGTPQANAQDAKAFMKLKDPKSDLQRIAALAYHLTHGKNLPIFKTRDLTTANTDAKGPKFHIPRAVGNAARAKCGYLSAVGGGKKQLSSYGEEIVEALPDQEAVKALEAKYKKGKRRGGRKKTSKKKA